VRYADAGTMMSRQQYEPTGLRAAAPGTDRLVLIAARAPYWISLCTPRNGTRAARSPSSSPHSPTLTGGTMCCIRAGCGGWRRPCCARAAPIWQSSSYPGPWKSRSRSRVSHQYRLSLGQIWPSGAFAANYGHFAVSQQTTFRATRRHWNRKGIRQNAAIISNDLTAYAWARLAVANRSLNRQRLPLQIRPSQSKTCR
jgi:hypothetical protein